MSVQDCICYCIQLPMPVLLPLYRLRCNYLRGLQAPCDMEHQQSLLWLVSRAGAQFLFLLGSLTE